MNVSRFHKVMNELDYAGVAGGVNHWMRKGDSWVLQERSHHSPSWRRPGPGNAERLGLRQSSAALGSVAWACESARGLAQSKSWRTIG